MAYYWRTKESLARGFRRIAREQIRGALRELSDPRLKRSDAIHQARKRCKMIRGLLRLVRPRHDEFYKTENAAFRDAAHFLSAMRENDAIVESFDRLCQDVSGAFTPGLLESIRNSIDAAHRNTLEAIAEEQIRSFTLAMQSALARIRKWPCSKKGDLAIEEGFSSTYNATRRAMFVLLDGPTDDSSLHEFRKRAKYHWYQVRLMRHVGSKKFRRRAQTLKKLSSLLGDDRDLVGLKGAIAHESIQSVSSHDRTELISAIVDRRRLLQADALQLGRELFSERKKTFAGKFHRLWKKWRCDS